MKMINKFFVIYARVVYTKNVMEDLFSIYKRVKLKIQNSFVADVKYYLMKLKEKL